MREYSFHVGWLYGGVLSGIVDVVDIKGGLRGEFRMPHYSSLDSSSWDVPAVKGSPWNSVSHRCSGRAFHEHKNSPKCYLIFGEHRQIGEMLIFSFCEITTGLEVERAGGGEPNSD